MGKIRSLETIKYSLINEMLSWFAETAKEILVLLDSDGKIKYINTALEKALQYDLSEIEEKNYLELVHEDDQNMTKMLVNAFRNNQYYPAYTNRHRRKDGTYVKLLWKYGKPTKEGWLQVMGQLNESETNNLDMNISPSDGLNIFFEMTDEAGDICDLEGRVIIVNSAFENLYGWTTDELLGKVLPIFPEHLHHELHDIKLEILSGKKIAHHQTFRLKKDGSLFPVSLIAAPIVDENGDVIAISAITKDLSELMEKKMMIEKQNETIAEQERFFREITESINEIICLYDVNTLKMLYLSPSFERIWGLTPEEAYENSKLLFEKVHPEDSEVFLETFRAPLTSPIEVEYRLINVGLIEEKWMRTKVTPMLDENGRVNKGIAVSQDITEWKKQDEMLKRQDKLGVLGQLAAGIAHEIRNPLTTIMGFTQLRAQESNDKYNEIILNELERIESIVTEFLMLANPHEEIEFKNENMNDILTEVIHFMQPEALLHNVEIYAMLNSTLPQVSCEPNQIKQVVINIIKNAIESMPTGGKILIKTSLLDDDHISIAITDEGTGIPVEMLDRLGEPFYSNKERGTGLGLMVSYKIIENHQGEIQFDNEDQGGTTVRISLKTI